MTQFAGSSSANTFRPKFSLDNKVSVGAKAHYSKAGVAYLVGVVTFACTRKALGGAIFTTPYVHARLAL